jgi:glutathione reductase (NADPH)
MANTYDLIVIGTGVAASKIAETCRHAGWRVAIVDRRPYGGTCRLRGCDPKKLLWGVAQSVEQARRFAHDGFAGKEISLSWPDLIRFKRSFLEGAPEAVEDSFRALGIETLHGRAHFVDPNKLAVDGYTAEARHFAIASGSTPAHLPVPGADHLLTSDDFMEMEELPDPLIFVGGGYISFEFAHIAARAGRKVLILHQDDRPLAQFDRELVDRLLTKSRRVGIEIHLDNPVEGIEKTEQGVKVWARRHGTNHPFEAAAAVHGAGRVPDIDDLDLAAGGIKREGHRLLLNQSLQSVSNPAVYAAGDAAAAGPMLTPVSELDADVVGENLLEGVPHRQPDYKGVPSVVFTIPPLASVGLTEEHARAQNLRFRVAHADISGWYSARRVKEDTAAFKILIEERTKRILGAHIVGPNADEVINLFALAIRLDLSADKLRQLVPAYPSQAANVEYMLD